MASSVVTGGVTISAATLAPLVEWCLNGCPHPIPDSVPFLIAAAIITVAHAVYNIAQAKLGLPAVKSPAT
jgi:hypothetical protein